MKRFPNGVDGDFFHQKRVPPHPDFVGEQFVQFPSGHTHRVRGRRQRGGARVGDQPRLHRAAHVALARRRHRAAGLPADRPRPDRRRAVAVRARDRARRAGRDGRARARVVSEDVGRDRAAHPRADQAGAACSRRCGGSRRRSRRRSSGASATRTSRRRRGASPTARGVFVDFGQNARDRTIACAYSVRPTPDARVSAPLALGRGRRRRAGGVHASRRCARGSPRSATRCAGCGAAAVARLPLRAAWARAAALSPSRSYMPVTVAATTVHGGRRRGHRRRRFDVRARPAVARRWRSSRQVQSFGSLSSRKRSSFVPWRKRLPCTLS